MRTNQEDDGKQDRLLEEKCDRKQLCAVFDALNYLGACAWKTNDRILDLAIHVFNDGGNDDLAIPGPVIQPDIESYDK
jgi:DNA-directed RNA polymerase